MALNRGGQWCSDGEMVSDVRRDWSQVVMVDNGGALITPFIGLQGDERWVIQGRKAVMVELQWHRL
jgi:hypothetical protein